MTRIRMLLGAAIVALPAFASAQQVSQLVEPFRKWDLGGGLGIRFGERDDAVVPAGNWMAEGTRYWTPHVKTSLQVTTAGQTASYGYQYDPRAFQSVSSQTNTRPAAYGVTTGYQFFDNEFVHPYVSAGVRFASVHTITTVQSLRPPYPAFTAATPDRLQVRPMIGGGFKSYFGNGRAFMRTELLLAIGPNGDRHAMLQIGSGVDF